MKDFIRRHIGILDVIALPAVMPAGFLMKGIRMLGIERFPKSREMLKSIGVFPIHRHFYDPIFDEREIPPRKEARSLPGIDWNEQEQLELLKTFKFQDEFLQIIEEAKAKQNPKAGECFFLENGCFEQGDADYWYQMIRSRKLRRIIEIGSGHSTMLARQAIAANQKDDENYACDHICIEPYEAVWLKSCGAKIIREPVENLDLDFFRTLESGDFLFIDSSHMIRPNGDVLREYLEILPILKAGVIVHIHDIFSPEDYPLEWLKDHVRLWNEQYILEAFLTHNSTWKIIGALNFLKTSHFATFRAVCPTMRMQDKPGSFYILKLS